LLYRVREVPATVAVFVLNVLAFAWTAQSTSGQFRSSALLAFGALEPMHVWAGDYWRLLACTFLHGGFVHIASNMYMAAGWAPTLERVMGSVRFSVIYVLAALSGSCASMISSWVFGAHMTVGASGALFGIVGAVLALRRRQFDSFGSFVRDSSVRSLLLQLALWTALGLTVLPLDNAAHAGGLAMGYVATALFAARARARSWVLFAFGLVALFVGAARPWWVPQGRQAVEFVADAEAYLTGYGPRGEAWPLDPARGIRFLTRGCRAGVPSACEALRRRVNARP